MQKTRQTGKKTAHRGFYARAQNRQNEGHLAATV